MKVTLVPKTFDGGQITVSFETLQERHAFVLAVKRIRASVARDRGGREKPIEGFEFGSAAQEAAAKKFLPQIKAMLGLADVEFLGKGTNGKRAARIVPLPELTRAA